MHHTPTSSKRTHGVVTENKSCAKRNSSSLPSYPVFSDRAKSGRISVRGAIIIGILIKQPGVFICSYGMLYETLNYKREIINAKFRGKSLHNS
jgi:hypothetical protein